MLRTITKWRHSSTAYREVRPLLFAIALGSTIALTLTIAAAFASKPTDPNLPETQEQPSTNVKGTNGLSSSGEARF